jgi:hypothetical protein
MGSHGHSGWLYLEDMNKINVWHLRYFVLDEGHLRYFTKEEDLDPLSTINVRGHQVGPVGKARIGKHAFRINVMKQADGRYKYVLAGETEADSLTWLKALVEQGLTPAGGSVDKIKVRGCALVPSLPRLDRPPAASRLPRLAAPEPRLPSSCPPPARLAASPPAGRTTRGGGPSNGGPSNARTSRR